MNRAFEIVNGKVQTTDAPEYWNAIKLDVVDSRDALGIDDPDVTIDNISNFLEENWRPEISAENKETGEIEYEVVVSDELWGGYKLDVMQEIRFYKFQNGKY